MKRMNEVFKLPLRCQDEECGTVGTVYDASGDIAMQAQSPLLVSAAACAAMRNERSALAAHAINNVDELADVLEFLLSLPRGSSGRIIIEKSEETLALAALNAYRGSK